MRDVDASVLQEAPRLERIFGVRPGLTFFVEPADMGTNALASPERLFQMPHGTVLLGINLLREEARAEGWGAAVSGIMAHEWAHIYQQQDPNLWAMPVPWKELHADFLAGWYLGIRHNEGWRFSFDAFMWSLYNKGDFGFYNPNHHGVPAQRAMAMGEGYGFALDTRERSVRMASIEGADHLYMRGNRVDVRLERSVRPCYPNCR